VALQESPQGTLASIDVDGDGRIDDDEVVPTGPDDSRPGARFELPTVTASGREATVQVAVRTSLRDGQRVLHLDQGLGARGTLPDGSPFGLRARSGVLDHPRTELVLDLNGDGELDTTNRLASVRSADGVVPWKGEHWQLSFRDDALVLDPTDAPLQGLRAGAPAPELHGHEDPRAHEGHDDADESHHEEQQTTDGQLHTLERYRGEPLLLDFWATWCAPCVRAHPELKALAAEHELTVLGVSADAELQAATRWMEQHPTPWPSIVEGPNGPVQTAYGVDGWPTYALIDAEGRLVVLGELSAVRGALASP
jgi:thiol-disulfide isomerase/thioredoxin